MAKAVGALGADIVRSEFAFEQGALALDEQRFSDALEHFVDASDAAACARRPGLALDAQHQRARVLAAVGRVAEAADAFADVERRWDEHGHDALAALATAELATLLARSGDGERSDALMAAAASRLGTPSLELQVLLLATRAEHASARGRSALAATLRGEAAALSRARGRLGDVARFSSDSPEAVEALRARDGYVRSAAVRAADRDNAEAVRCLLTGEPAAVLTAADHLVAALDRTPSPWYRLNQAYAAAQRGDWAEAVTMLTEVLDEAPRLRCAALEARLGEFHVAHGEALLKAGRYEEAADAFAGSVALLDRPSQSAARARCLSGRGDSLRAAGDPAAAVAAYREAEAAGAPSASLHLGELLAADDSAAARRRVPQGDRRRRRRPRRPRRHAPARTPTRDDAAGAARRRRRRAAARAGDRRRRAARALLLGERLAAAGRTEAAEIAYRLADPALPEATLRLARSSQSRELFERAERGGDRAVALQAATELGDLLAAAGDETGAAAAYGRAIARGRRSVGGGPAQPAARPRGAALRGRAAAAHGRRRPLRARCRRGGEARARRPARGDRPRRRPRGARTATC